MATTLSSASAAPPKTAGTMRVAVAEFTNATPDDAWDALGKGLQSMLTTDLAAVGQLELVERERLADIQTELKLSRGKAFDRKTAVRMGKLAGATHMVTGSFVVVGETMRLDGRLLNVRTGKVMATATSEGERDAFFELEKVMARRLLKAMGVKPKAKERALLGKIHTADLDAFKAFSEGLVHQDAKRWQDAVRALEKAAEIDTDFQLAKLTLSDVTRIASEAKTHASAAKTAELEARRLAREAKTSLAHQVVQRLLEMRGDRATGKLQRLVATHLLTDIYSHSPGSGGPLQAFSQEGDHFAHQRMADRLSQTYSAEAMAVYPKVSPVVVTELYSPFPTSMAGLGPYLAKAEEAARKSHNDFAKDPTYHAAHAARRLHMDVGGEAALADRLYEMAAGTQDADWKVRNLVRLAERHTDIVDVDASTRRLQEVRKLTTDSRTLDKVAKRLADNRELLAITQSGAASAEIREFMSLGISRPIIHDIKRVKKLFTDGQLTPDALKELNRRRKWHFDPRRPRFVLVGDTPAFTIIQRSSAEVISGPMTVRRHTRAVRYFSNGKRDADKTQHMVVLGGDPHDRFELALTVDRRRAKDWVVRRADETPSSAQPALTLLFGLRDIHAEGHYDKETRKQTGARPLTGFGVRVSGGEASLVTVQQRPNERRPEQYDDDLVLTQVSAKSVSALQDRATKVRLIVGDDVTLHVGDSRVSFPRPAELSTGFAGLELRGAGYLEWQDPVVTSR